MKGESLFGLPECFFSPPPFRNVPNDSPHGTWLADMVTQVSAAFELKSAVKPEQVWNGVYLPRKADRMVFPK